MSIHATTVAINGRGVIILGAPGAGKSDLALRLVDQPGYGIGGELLTATLVADDQTEVRVENGALIASAPAPLAGLMEIRGAGIVRLAAVDSVVVTLVVRLGAAGSFARLPDDPYTDLLGLRLPCIAVDPAQASAPARVRAALAVTASPRGNHSL